MALWQIWSLHLSRMEAKYTFGQIPYGVLWE